MAEFIEEVKLLAVRDGQYTMYVFSGKENKYIMCTRLPNWQVPDITVGEEGFLQYQIVQAGDSYYDPSSEKNVKYRYSNIYFMNFIKKVDTINNKIIL